MKGVSKRTLKELRLFPPTRQLTAASFSAHRKTQGAFINGENGEAGLVSD